MGRTGGQRNPPGHPKPNECSIPEDSVGFSGGHKPHSGTNLTAFNPTYILNGSTPEQVLSIPPDFYLCMGLQRVLTAQWLNSRVAILSHVKRRSATEI